MTSAVLAKLVQLLNIQAIETNVFMGQSEDLGFPALFGGQVLGQALVAAGRTVASDRLAHSLHGYFLRAGDPLEPLYYEVDLIRSGGSFSTRRVVAKQKGLAIFSMSASFQKMEAGMEHQVAMPSAAGPDGLESDLEVARRLSHLMPPAVRAKFTVDRAIEVRAVDPIDMLKPKPSPASNPAWIRLAAALPDDPLLHQAFLAYASDIGLAPTALRPHGASYMQPGVQLASIDHAMWFHCPFRWDGWLLYTKDSPVAAGARGLNHGQIFTQDGVLIASVAQEGLMRRRPQAAPKA